MLYKDKQPMGSGVAQQDAGVVGLAHSSRVERQLTTLSESQPFALGNVSLERTGEKTNSIKTTSPTAGGSSLLSTLHGAVMKIQ